MNIRHKIIISLALTAFIFSCTKKICPAYQSSFLLNKEDQDEYFSYFVESEQEESGTAITDIHHDGDTPNLSTDIGHDSGTKPKQEEYPIQPSKKDKYGISQGPIVKNKKSKTYKKQHYVVEMKDVYSEDSTSVSSLATDSLKVDTDNFSDTTALGGF